MKQKVLNVVIAGSFLLFTCLVQAQRLSCRVADHKFNELIQESITKKKGYYWLEASIQISIAKEKFSGSILLMGNVLDGNGFHQGNGVWMVDENSDEVKIYSAGDGANSDTEFESISIEEQVRLYDTGDWSKLRFCHEKIFGKNK